MAIAKLVEEDFCKFIVSTNGDGLHLRSGVPVTKISELHGNSFKYICKACNSNLYCLNGMKKDEKLYCITQGTCPKCYNGLSSSGVAFGADLPQDEWKTAKENSAKCDLAFVLGTSMRVSPACNLPEHSYKNKGHLVICNLQKTPYDRYAALVIREKTDVILDLLMKELSLNVNSPPKQLNIKQ